MITASNNPFRVERIHALPYTDPDFDWGSLLGRLKEMDYCGTISGPHGNGKTTLMLELCQRLEKQGHRTKYLRLNEENRRLPSGFLEALRSGVDSRKILLLDGAEQLGPMAWRRLRRATRESPGLIITTHKAGRLPSLYHCQTSRDTLDVLLRQLIPEQAPALQELAQQLYEIHQGDIRSILFALYDHFAEQE